MNDEVYNKFVSDYNNPNITTHDVRRINQLNSKKYCKIRNMAVKNGDIPSVRHMNRTNAKFYTKKNNGCYEVAKQYKNGKKLYVGRFPNERIAKKVVRECINNNWNLKLIRDFIEDNKLKTPVKNYSIINGYYVIQKSINGKNTIFATIKSDTVDEETVKEIVGKFREVSWNISYKDDIFRLFNIG